MEYKFYKDITLKNQNIKVYYIKKKSLKRSIKYTFPFSEATHDNTR